MRLTLAIVALAACSGGKDSGDGDTDATTDTSETTPPDPDVAAGDDEPRVGEVVCDSPSARASEPFVRKQAHEMPMSDALLSGGGLVIEDFDGDGLLDLFLPSDDDAQVWFGTGDELFDEVASSALAGIDISDAVGGTAIDYDADGDLDLYVTRWATIDRLLRNNGDRTFTDVTDAAGLGAHVGDPPVQMLSDVVWGAGEEDVWAQRWRDRALYSQSSSWADVDADGDVDLFVGTYGQFTILDVLEPTPDCGDHIADPSELWLNDGDGTFTDASDRLPDAVHHGYGFMSGWYDLDADGFPELFTAHDDGLCASSVLVDNLDGQTLSVDAGSNFHPDAFDMGMGVADLNADGLPDFLLTSWNAVYYVQSTVSPLGDNGVLYVDHTNTRELFIDGAPRDNPGVASSGQQIYGWGAEFGDVDNDGDLDAAMGFGYWSFYDGAGDPVKQRDGVWLQADDGTFSDTAGSLGLDDDGVTRGLVFADLNGDGWLDLTKRLLSAQTPMYMSRCGTEAWLDIAVRQPGANTHAIGARVRVTTGDTTRTRWIQSGSSGMYSGSPLRAHFGFGDLATVDEVEVVWPDGQVSRFTDVLPRQRLTITRDG